MVGDVNDRPRFGVLQYRSRIALDDRRTTGSSTTLTLVRKGRRWIGQLVKDIRRVNLGQQLQVTVYVGIVMVQCTIIKRSFVLELVSSVCTRRLGWAGRKDRGHGGHNSEGSKGVERSKGIVGSPGLG